MIARCVLNRRRGAVLVTFAMALIVIFGFMGLAFDVGRLYLARNEAQAFCDAAALAGAVMLNGKKPDLALDAVDGTFMGSTGTWKRFDFQNTGFTNYTVKFAQDSADGPFVELARGANAAGYRFIEVTATASLPMYLSPILTGVNQRNAAARAVGAQVKKDYWDEGLAPFAPKGHCSDSGTSYGLKPCAGDPDAGLVECPVDVQPYSACPAQSQYTLRWGANAWSQSFKNYRPTIDDGQWCAGDQVHNDPAYNPAAGCTGADCYQGTLGYALAEWYKFGTGWVDGTGFFNTANISSANDYATLISGAMGTPIDLNTEFQTFAGQEPKQVQSISTPLDDRAQLGPPQSYVYMPIIDPITGIIKTIGAFELIPGGYGGGGNGNWCAVYRGQCTYPICTDQVKQDGIYEIRLVR